MDLKSLWSLILVGIVFFFIGYFTGKIIKYFELRNERKQAVRKSRSIILWESYEKLAPFMPHISYFPKDMHFLWKWVDYVVFNGLSNWDLKEIVFLEIKSGKSSLNKNEKQIKNIISAKKVRYEVVYFDKK